MENPAPAPDESKLNLLDTVSIWSYIIFTNKVKFIKLLIVKTTKQFQNREVIIVQCSNYYWISIRLELLWWKMVFLKILQT